LIETPYIIHTEGDIIGLYKPAGYLTHSVGDGVPDAVSWLETTHKILAAPIHRLDKPVSGVLLLERRPPLEIASSPVRWDAVQKDYVAIVHGLTRRKGVVRRAIKDGRRGRPLDAETRYRTLAHSAKESLVAVRLITGRKHQIRRHFDGIGHGVIGDKRYGRKTRRWQGEHTGIWLHAQALELPDGTRFSAPIGAAWRDALEHLGWSHLVHDSGVIHLVSKAEGGPN